VRLQVRSSNLADMSDATWVGPDGTGATYFTSTQPTILPSVINAHRYLQIQVLFTSDSIRTPTIESIQVNYQK
jgi:hypothetical protein